MRTWWSLQIPSTRIKKAIWCVSAQVCCTEISLDENFYAFILKPTNVVFQQVRWWAAFLFPYSEEKMAAGRSERTAIIKTIFLNFHFLLPPASLRQTDIFFVRCHEGHDFSEAMCSLHLYSFHRLRILQHLSTAYAIHQMKEANEPDLRPIA